MKRLLKISSVTAALATFALVGPGCNKVKDFGDTNVNPGATSTPVTSALLTNVEAGIGDYAVSIQPGQYAQYFSETQYPGTSLYTAPILSFSGLYSGDLYDLQNIINQNTDPATKGIVGSAGTNANQIAVARILKAYIFWTITDRWGDIPYSEALKGIANKLPKYDTQKAIYEDLIKELKEANAQFDNTGTKFAGDVLMNVSSSTATSVWSAKWKKFANSLRMLIALRTSKIYPGATEWAATEFKSALNDAAGYISANNENIVVGYVGTNYPNPFYSNYVVSARVDNAESKVVTDFLSNNNDPRLASYGTTPNGFPYGLDRANAVLITSGIAYILKGPGTAATDPVNLLTAAVVTFARAEAAERGWTPEVAAALYVQGITLSFAQYGYTATQAANYVAQTNILYGTGNLEKIGTQRWLATYPDGTQAWAEWRRTGFPVLTPAPYATNPGKQIPRRYIYGTDEYSLNGTNAKAAAARMSSGDVQDSKVWWDK
ncbi:SusD/RagB family nutrient-binding outer membrane lipoprotein [Sediminibacterium soli]|uniref:SusD/RagB family nutrient-binding outer membrane lipoprotein n=1 Tax=Sediminibacterium soli TaxID=2698829 RepID=UPI00137B7FD2|nr:SusD/RagB family nutrient-binding outer membrane lipoprotein [Sediminibacterium soli]NCI47269.1 SusD/RagB family nutrient-binding outer membrane lipoprotein [Sediminibacterium soli]